MEYDKYTQEVGKGLLILAVLQVISLKKAYASDILSGLAETSFSTKEGTLYPMLSKLRREGLVVYEWEESESGPPRKYYYLSEEGMKLRKELMNTLNATRKELTDLGTPILKNLDKEKE